MRVDAKVRTERPKVRVNGPLGLYKTAQGKCKFTRGACKTARIPSVNQLNPATCGNHSAASFVAPLSPSSLWSSGIRPLCRWKAD